MVTAIVKDFIDASMYFVFDAARTIQGQGKGVVQQTRHQELLIHGLLIATRILVSCGDSLILIDHYVVPFAMDLQKRLVADFYTNYFSVLQTLIRFT
jgi:hypothetical protein